MVTIHHIYYKDEDAEKDDDVDNELYSVHYEDNDYENIDADNGGG